MQFSYPSAVPLRTVLDTNVIMALWVFHDPNLTLLKNAIDSQGLVLLTQPDCLDELQRVLNYEQFSLSQAMQQSAYDKYLKTAQCLPAANEEEMQTLHSLPQCKDRDDQKFLQLAWRSQATLLLTRDKLLLKLARRPPLRERLIITTPELWVRHHTLAILTG